LPRRDPEAGRKLGRAVLHRHRFSARLLPQLPSVPAGVSRNGNGSRSPVTSLLVLAPLRAEAVAVRGGRVLRTGMGPARARIAAARAPAIAAAAAAVAGVRAAVAPRPRSGPRVR